MDFQREAVGDRGGDGVVLHLEQSLIGERREPSKASAGFAAAALAIGRTEDIERHLAQGGELMVEGSIAGAAEDALVDGSEIGPHSLAACRLCARQLGWREAIA